MANSAAVVRGRHMQTFLQQIDTLPDGDRTAIRQALSPSTLERIEGVSSVDWVPVAMNLEVTRVVSVQLGSARAPQFFRDFLLAGFATPILHAFVTGAVRLAGSDPGAAFKWIPTGYGLIFRDCGVWATRDRTSSSMAIEVTSLPVLMRDPIWVTSVAGSFGAIFDLTQKQGTVVVESFDVGAGTVVFRARWQP